MFQVGWVEVTIFVLLIFWLILLSLFFWKEKRFLDRVFPKKGWDTEKDSFLLIRDHFDQILDLLDQVEKKEAQLRKVLKEVAFEGLEHIQKVEVSRYNPYGDTGGDQSFTIALLNGKMDGLLISSLHSRSGTRVYVKPIKSGKAQLELSKEESEILKKTTEEN